MAPPETEIQKTGRDLAEQLFALENQRAQFENQTSGIIDGAARRVADFFSGADSYLKTYDTAASGAEFALGNADDALAHGEAEPAARFLSSAKEYIHRASLALQNYHREGSEGACDGGNMAGMGAGALSGVGVGGAAVLLGSGPVGWVAGGAVGIHGVLVGPSVFGMDCLNSAEAVNIEIPPKPRWIERRPPPVSKREPTWLKKPEKSAVALQSDAEKICKPSVRGRSRANVTDSPCTAPGYALDKIALKRKLKTKVKTVKEPVPTVRDLLLQAHRALEDWKQNPRARHDFGSFLLAANAATSRPPLGPQRYGAVAQKWRGLVARYGDHVTEAAKPWQDSIRLVVDDVFSTLPISGYVRANGRMVDILDGAGGNCRAESETFVSAVSATSILVPEPYREGVQMSADPHIQYVVYKKEMVDGKETHWVWNPMTGQVDDEVKATINDPHIFYHSFIQDFGSLYGITSPVTEEELVIAEPTVVAPPLVTQDYWTNQSFALHGKRSGFLFDGGPVPEFSYIPPPGAEEIKGERNADPQGTFGQKKAYSLKDYGSPQAPSEMEGREFLDMGERILFRTPEQAEYYTRIENNREARKNFLIALTIQSLLTALNDPSFEKLMDLLDNPWRAAALPADEIVQAAQLAWKISRIVGAQGIEEERLLGYPQISDQCPSFGALRDLVSSFLDKLKEDPLPFVLLLNGLTHEKRMAFLEFFLRLGGSNLEKNAPGQAEIQSRDLLEDLLKNPRRIGIGIPPGRQPKEPSPREEKPEEDLLPDFIHARFSFKKEEKGDPGQKGLDRGKDKIADSPQAPYRVTSEAMVDFYFASSESLVQARPWTPGFAREVERLNIDGRYDLSILNGYDLIDNGSLGVRDVQVPDEIFQLQGLLDSFKGYGIGRSRADYERLKKVSRPMARLLYGIVTRMEKNRQILSRPYLEDVRGLLGLSNIFPSRIFRTGQTGSN
ncbi:MAG: hypothetical protein Q7T11_00420 [Deltaproteobacteria bacterium]|nr:hypothetical protein [Deltaproteobacteria bacterium]